MKVVCFACDCYADLAPAWEYCWHKQWPDCPHEVTYIANTVKLKVGGTVHHVKSGDTNFGSRLKLFISRHIEKGELILFVLIDHLAHRLDITTIAEAEKLCARSSVGCVRLYPMPRPQLPFPTGLRAGIEWSKFGLIDKSRPYSLSTQPAIWDAHVLLQLLKDGESPWHTETFGSGRTKRVKEVFLGTHGYAVAYVNFWYRRKPLGVGWVRENVPERLWPKAAKEGR